MKPLSVLLAALLLASAAPARAAERIITLAPHLAELVCTVGACKKLAGVVLYTDYPPEAKARPLVGDALNLNYEEIVALQPDLVLSWDGGTAPETVQRLRQLGLRVEPIRVRTLRDIAGALIQIGELAGTGTSARFAAKLFYTRLEQLRNTYWKRSRLRIMYQIESDPVYTVTDRSPISEAIKLCGGDNVFAKLTQIAPAISVEALLAANPEVVVFARQDNPPKIREFWARWPQAQAQRRGTLYEVDGNLLTRQSPRMLDGVEQLCNIFDQARTALGRRH